MRELFIDCSSGVAGDMLGASLLSLFDDPDHELELLNRIGIPGIEYSLEQVNKYGIRGNHLRVRFNGLEEGKDSEHGDNHSHKHHIHRSVQQIFEVLEHLNLSDSVVLKVKTVYQQIAEAEAHVHGCSVEHIHFHELGTMDAIADICAVCFLIERLNADRIIASPICTGFGHVECAHGVMPVPAPATAFLLKGIPCFSGDLEGELCTPTGVALIKCLADAYSNMPKMKVCSIGFGIGQKDFGRLSAVRALLGESDSVSEKRIQFLVKFSIREGSEEEYLAKLKPCVLAARNEPGNIEYIPFWNPEQRIMTLIESYYDEECLSAHIQSSHYLNDFLALKQYYDAPVVVEKYTNPVI